MLEYINNLENFWQEIYQTYNGTHRFPLKGFILIHETPAECFKK